MCTGREGDDLNVHILWKLYGNECQIIEVGLAGRRREIHFARGGLLNLATALMLRFPRAHELSTRLALRKVRDVI